MSKKVPIPVNSIFVTVTKPVADIIKTNGGLELYLDSKWHHEQHVSCTGKVASLPKDNPFEGQLQEGDEVLLSFFLKGMGTLLIFNLGCALKISDTLV
jgi:hypothetical protein